MIRLTRDQVRRIDQLAVEQYGIPGIVLMENAARAVVDVAMQMLSNASQSRIVIACGPGNNGGDALAAARHLHNKECEISLLFTCDPDDIYRGDAWTNWQILRPMTRKIDPAIRIIRKISEVEADLIIDGIFGTGLTRPPAEDAARAIEEMNQSDAPTLAVDIPSGLDCDTGMPLGHCVRAARTVTFVAEKIGFANPFSKAYTGEIIVGDIGCPRELIDAVR